MNDQISISAQPVNKVLGSQEKQICSGGKNPVLVNDRYYGQLDGLRFISIFGVLLQHFINPKYSHFLLSGNAGVDLFFVISGFLITENLLKLKSRHTILQGLKVFYSRRILRIFPLYYLYWLILLLFFYPVVSSYKWDGLFYLINFYDISHDLSSYTGHLWSLSVEEQFYIAWPLFLFWVAKKRVISLVIILLVFGSTFSLYHYYFNPNQGYTYFHTISCSIALLSGALLASYKQYNNSVFKKLISVAGYLAPLMIGIFLSISVLFRIGWIEEKETFFIRPCISLLGIYLVGRVASAPFTGRFGNFLNARFVRKIGQMAYGIYIFHYMVFTLARPVLDNLYSKFFNLPFLKNSFFDLLRYNSSFLLFPVNVLLVLTIAWVSFTFFESRILAYKRYFK